jgi:hypothetical protein
MIPVPKPTKFIDEIEEILRELEKAINSEPIKSLWPKLSKENVFNRRFSGLLDAFSDVKCVAERLTENIEQLIIIERKNRSNEKIDQDLMKKAHELSTQNKTDLKNLYVNSKIFLDEYTNLIRFIFDWRGIGNKSVTSFFNDLEKYNGENKDILLFKEKCLGRLRAIKVYITDYRDEKIVHNQQKHKQDTQWFLNNMNGEIRFIGGGRPSITPQEVLFIVVNYIDDSATFCIEWLNRKIKK